MTAMAKHKITQPQKLLGVLTIGHLVNDFYSKTLPFLLPTLIVAFDLSYFEAGLLGIATSLLSGILEPVVGYLADLFAKRKMIILFGFFAYCLGLIIAGYAISYPILLFAFFVFGLGQSTFHAQSTNLITKEFPSSRGRSLGIHGIGGSIGNFSAPILITFLITAMSWRYATNLLAVPGLLMIIFLGTMISEPPKAQSLSNRTPVISARLLLLTFNFGLISMAFIGFLTFLPTFLVENRSTLEQAGLVAAVMLFVGFFAQPIGGVIYDKLGGRFLFATSSLLAGVGLWLFTVDSIVPSIIFIVIIGFAVQATYPVALAMASEIARGETVGASVGFVFGVSSVMASFSSAVTGYAADLFGLQASFRLLVVLLFLSLGVSFMLPGRRRVS